jgi:hypothetical protein
MTCSTAEVHRVAVSRYGWCGCNEMLWMPGSSFSPPPAAGGLMTCSTEEHTFAVGVFDQMWLQQNDVDARVLRLATASSGRPDGITYTPQDRRP